MPHESEFQRRIHEGLDRAWERAERLPHVDIQLATAKWVIFSDQHKGVRDGADDFKECEAAYNAALAWYFTHGYTLVELGDVEELWEERPKPVVQHYRRTLDLTAKFHHAGRYYRFWGNHDDAWSFQDQVRRHLADVYGDITVHEGLVLHIRDGDEELGTAFMVHGHQGTGASDRWGNLARVPVRFFWRPLQRVFRVSLNTPAKDWGLGCEHNVAMFSWAETTRRLLIAGHTHRPVFLSKTQAEKLELAIDAARQAGDNVRLADLLAEMEWLRAQEGSSDGAPTAAQRREPWYFNSGCCSYTDGTISGLEIVDGDIMLVRWPDVGNQPRRRELDRLSLREVFSVRAPEGALPWPQGTVVGG